VREKDREQKHKGVEYFEVALQSHGKEYPIEAKAQEGDGKGSRDRISCKGEGKKGPDLGVGKWGSVLVGIEKEFGWPATTISAWK